MRRFLSIVIATLGSILDSQLRWESSNEEKYEALDDHKKHKKEGYYNEEHEEEKWYDEEQEKEKCYNKEHEKEECYDEEHKEEK